jgi:hypothetical protein
MAVRSIQWDETTETANLLKNKDAKPWVYRFARSHDRQVATGSSTARMAFGSLQWWTGGNMSIARIELPQENVSADDELEKLARELIEGMDPDDARQLCLALLELYHQYVKPVYH